MFLKLASKIVALTCGASALALAQLPSVDTSKVDSAKAKVDSAKTEADSKYDRAKANAQQAKTSADEGAAAVKEGAGLIESQRFRKTVAEARQQRGQAVKGEG